MSDELYLNFEAKKFDKIYYALLAATCTKVPYQEDELSMAQAAIREMVNLIEEAQEALRDCSEDYYDDLIPFL